MRRNTWTNRRDLKNEGNVDRDFIAGPPTDRAMLNVRLLAKKWLEMERRECWKRVVDVAWVVKMRFGSFGITWWDLEYALAIVEMGPCPNNIIIIVIITRWKENQFRSSSSNWTSSLGVRFKSWIWSNNCDLDNSIQPFWVIGQPNRSK